MEVEKPSKTGQLKRIYDLVKLLPVLLAVGNVLSIILYLFSDIFIGSIIGGSMAISVPMLIATLPRKTDAIFLFCKWHRTLLIGQTIIYILDTLFANFEWFPEPLYFNLFIGFATLYILIALYHWLTRD